MKSLVLLVEDDVPVVKILTRFLEAHKISYISAQNLMDAIELFGKNKDLITHIALDGNLGGDPSADLPNTLVLAEIIADSKHFQGKVLVMATLPDHNNVLKGILGDKSDKFVGSSKIEVIKEIIRKIEEKRDKEKITSKGK